MRDCVHAPPGFCAWARATMFLPVTKSAIANFRRRHPPLLPAQPPIMPGYHRWLGGEEGWAAPEIRKADFVTGENPPQAARRSAGATTPNGIVGTPLARICSRRSTGTGLPVATETSIR